jgi:hypothetical protein
LKYASKNENTLNDLQELAAKERFMLERLIRNSKK